MVITHDTLAILNSLTKYPSILTYHKLGEKGRLLPERNWSPSDSQVILTEKVDGTNSRVIFLPPGKFVFGGVRLNSQQTPLECLIGSREEILHNVGDFIYNPEMAIVETLLASNVLRRQGFLMDRFGNFRDCHSVVVLYLEVFGQNIGRASKEYARLSRGVRLFDIATIPLDVINEHLKLHVSDAANWRDSGGQTFIPHDLLSEIDLPRVPVVGTIEGSEMPESLVDTQDFLRKWISSSHCKLDEGVSGRPEGLVVRTKDRTSIAKMRYEDYARTLR